MNPQDPNLQDPSLQDPNLQIDVEPLPVFKKAGEVAVEPEFEVYDSQRESRFQLSPPPALWRKTLAAAFGVRGSLLLFVILPTIVCGVYLGIIASDQFMAEAQFAVRSASALGGVPQGEQSNSSSALTLPNMASQDAYVIADYIRSRAIFEDLPRELDVRAIYQRPEADFWARLPQGASIEKLAEYWRSMVLVYVDGPSGVVTVRVRAFRPEDAKNLAEAVVAASERLANRLSARELHDLVAQAESEVRRTQELVLKALSDERNYRDKIGFVDPVKQAGEVSTLLLSTLSQKIALQTRLYVAERSMADTSPRVTDLKSQAAALEEQIAALRAKLTSAAGGADTVSAALSEFDRLEIQRQFSEKLYTFSQEALERARLTGEKQNIYLAVFERASLPEYAEYPQRWGLLAIFGSTFLAVWGIAALTTATVLDHTY